jgi:ATP-dependent Lon protease
VILPKANEKDVPDLPEALKTAMKLHFVDQMDEVLKLALEAPLKALEELATPDAATLAAIPPSELTGGQTARQ